MRDNMDILLRQALTPTEDDEPSPCMKQNILLAYEESDNMKHKFIKRPAMAMIAAAAIIASGSLTAVAAWHYLKPAEVAKELGDEKLTDAFEDGDAISVNESQTIKDYKITLHSIVSGKSISSSIYLDADGEISDDGSYTMNVDGEISDDRSYAVISIEKKDGTPMASSDKIVDVYDKEPFMVSPFIQGYSVRDINMFTTNTGVSTFMKDGIMYKLLDCDTLEPFADREVYIGVLKSEDENAITIDNSAYEMDKKTGRILRTENYTGINALFTLPLDRDKADKKKADTLLKEWLDPSSEEDKDEEEDALQRHFNSPEYKIKKWPIKKIEKVCTYIKDCTQTLKPDKDGVIHFVYKHDNCCEGDKYINAKYIFRNKKAGSKEVTGVTGSDSRIHVFVTTKGKNGNYIVKMYYLDRDKWPEEESGETQDPTDEWSAEQVQKEGVYLKQFTKNIKPDKDHMIRYKWKYESNTSSINVNADYLTNKPGVTEILGRTSDSVREYFELGTRQKDGSFTIQVYYIDLGTVQR